MGTSASARPRTVYVKTWGCQMNEYDSRKMVDILHDRCQFEAVSEPEGADLILMNTCSVREKAQEKVFSELGRWRKIKQLRPDVVIGVGGCVASQEGELLRRRAPWVDIVFGPQTLHRLPEMFESVRTNKRAVVDISFPAVEKFDELAPARRDGVAAYVSIMEGCSKYCSFCVVPYTRGREVSRDWRGVVAEIDDLSRLGVREVCLLGQNVNAWRGHDEAGRPADFAWLLKLVSAVDGIDRIRYTTSHPLEMTAGLVEAHSTVSSLMPFVHLPVQSGSDKILAAMKRGYTVLEYKNIIRQLRRARTDVSLSSDFIVGFPGESEDDHRQTMALAEEIFFDHSYSFVYSARPGTPAAALPNQVKPDIAARRLQELQELLAEQSRRSRQALAGTTAELLVEMMPDNAPDERIKMRGRTPCNRVVYIPTDPALQGQLVQVRISAVTAGALEGAIIGDGADRSTVVS
ncbi:MAG: tRNA (N6-isopentenyl adenosine(37)-C2)-methylthiotransferase MiaB [Gammaproteobacteria bacterium]|nr:tRNA (N6-isopentenyl adenosine(37)-C2)-methylthiotransferase MiaB [Gammaproteobacteria bacterium]